MISLPGMAKTSFSFGKWLSSTKWVFKLLITYGLHTHTINEKHISFSLKNYLLSLYHIVKILNLYISLLFTDLYRWCQVICKKLYCGAVYFLIKASSRGLIQTRLAYIDAQMRPMNKPPPHRKILKCYFLLLVSVYGPRTKWNT